MEPANIDWKTVKSKFVLDEFYEDITAPKWVDFTAPEDPVDDEAWFCKPDCRHPKTAEDFLRPFPNPKTRHLRSASVLEPLPLGDRNSRDNFLKRRAHVSPKISSTSSWKPELSEDCENQNPNLATPPQSSLAKSMKAAIKSSSEKKKKNLLTSSPSDPSEENRKPLLKSTLSARNLFAGRDILNQITDFCSELKKLATRTKEKEVLEKSNLKKMKKKGVEQDLNENEKEKKPLLAVDLNENEKEKKPLLADEKENCESGNSNKKEKQMKIRRNENTENIQVQVDMKKVVGQHGMESSPQVRTCPPSPQCFSAPRGPLRPAKTATTPLRPSKTMPTERGVLQEVEQKHRVPTNESAGNDKASNRNISLITSTEEARSLDIFWLFKPCTNFST